MKSVSYRPMMQYVNCKAKLSLDYFIVKIMFKNPDTINLS